MELWLTERLANSATSHTNNRGEERERGGERVRIYADIG